MAIRYIKFIFNVINNYILLIKYINLNKTQVNLTISLKYLNTLRVLMQGCCSYLILNTNSTLEAIYASTTRYIVAGFNI